MASEPLTLAKLALAVGTSIENVRLYKDRGLLPFPRRSPGNSGVVGYHQEHVDRLRFIARALVFGFSLDAIALLVDTSKLMTCHDVLDIAAGQHRRLQHLLGPGALSAAVL